MSFLDPLTVLVIAVAAIVGWRLWSALGQRTGFERDWSKPSDATPAKLGETAQTSQTSAGPTNRWARYGDPESPVTGALESIAGRDRTFDPEAFLAGASRAYEMINIAFAKGDKKALQSLLSRDVMRDFAADIDRRSAAGESMTWQLVKVESAKFQDASLTGNLARLTVHFSSSVISSATAKDGTVVAGHTTAIEKVEDVWTFERPVNSGDPNWKLVATSPE